MVAADTYRTLRWRKYSYEKRPTNEGRSDEAVDSSAVLLRIRKVQVQSLSERPDIFITDFRLFLSSLHANADITNSSKQSPSWEADSFSANKEISSILLNPKVRYLLQSSAPLVPHLRQINTVHAPQAYFLKINFNTAILGLPSGSSEFSIKTMHACFTFPYVPHAPPIWIF